MKTIFLAAGRSSRMEPIGDKNFLAFCGEPLLLHLLRNAHQASCTEFIVVCNQDNLKRVRGLCQSHDFLKTAQVTIQPNVDDGMAGGVLAGLKLVSDEESLLVHNGNDFVECAAIKDVITQTKQRDGAVLGQKVSEYFPGGYLVLDSISSGSPAKAPLDPHTVPSGRRVKGIVEKPGEGREPSDLVNIVVHGFARAGDLKSALSSAKSQRDDVYEVALDQLFKTKQFVAVEYDGVWQAIKYPWHVLEMMDVLLGRQKSYTDPSAKVAPSAQIKGDHVVIEAGARVFENAVICGPAYLGKNALVGNNALVRGSVIGENSVVGYNTEVARSWLGPSITSHMAYVGDSVVDAGVNFGAFSCTANLRLDKKTVRVNVKEEKVDSKHVKLGAIVGQGTQIGIGAKLMPGCKTPPHTLVRPGEIWY